jgi:hypothetical protein
VPHRGDNRASDGVIHTAFVNDSADFAAAAETLHMDNKKTQCLSEITGDDDKLACAATAGAQAQALHLLTSL